MTIKLEPGEPVHLLIKEKQRVHPLVRAQENPKSRVRAIKAMCIRCMGGTEEDPVPVADIKGCTSPKCPLYALRPYK